MHFPGMIVGPQQQLGAVFHNELRQIHGVVLVSGLGGLHNPSPGHEVFDGPAFHRRELGRNGVVGKQIEERLLGPQLRAETINHAHRAFLIRAHQGVIQIEADQELLECDVAIDNVNGEFAPPQYVVAILQLVR